MPEYAKGLFSFEFHEELTSEIWKEVADIVRGQVELPFDEELLYDAKTFCDSLRYDAAVLFAAFATELIIGQACKNLLKAKGNLTDEQCEAVLGPMNNPELRKLLRTLEPTFAEPEGLQKVFETRNKIAHGKLLSVTWQEAREAIQTTEDIKRRLASLGAVR